MDETTKTAKTSMRQRDRRAVWISAVLLLGLAVPWLLEDPVSRDLRKVPLRLRPPPGMEFRKLHQVIHPHGSSDATKRYLAQFVFEATNRSDQPVRGLRLSLAGTDADGQSLFRVSTRPPIFNLEPGATQKGFVRIMDLDLDVIANLHEMTLGSQARW